METRDTTLKVGLVIGAAIILGVLGFMVLQDVQLRGTTEIYYVDYDSREGTSEGTPVRMHGNPIGKIVSFDMLPAGARATLRLKTEYNDKPVQLYPEFVFVVAQDDLFGEKYVSVVDPISDINEIADRLVDVLDSIMELAASDAQTVRESGDYSVRRAELTAVYNQLARLVQDPRQLRHWRPVLADVEELSTNLASLAAPLDKRVIDPEVLQGVIEDVRLTTDSLEKTRSAVIKAKSDMNVRAQVAPEFVFTGHNRSGIGNMLAGAFTETMNEAGISGALEAVISVMGSESLQESLVRFEETLTNINALVLSVSEVVTGSEGYVTGSLANVHAMSENFRSMSEDLHALSSMLAEAATDPQERARWERVLVNIEQTTANINSLTASLDELAGDDALQQDIKDSVRLTRETLEETKETVVRFQDTLDNVDSTLESADSLMGTAEGTIVEAKDKLDKLGRVGDAIEIKMGLNVRAVDLDDNQSLGNEDVYVGDLNAAVGYEDTYVYFGADDIGEENNFNLMMGYGDLAGLSFRGGVYRGELGLGAAYYGDLGAEVTWYDTEDPKVNAYGYIPIADKLNLVVGGEDLGNDPMASVGVGVELQ